MTTLNVNGMSCIHCEKAVTKALKAVKGVKKINVDLAAKTVSVDFNEKKTDLAAISQAIADAGYEVV